MNLGTEINGVAFHPNEKMMGFWSRWKKQGVRLVELDERRVVPHFPRLQDKLKFAMCFDFSGDGGLMGVGNDEGKAHLF